MSVPPDVPPVTRTEPALVDYLRRFSLWSKRELDAKVPARAAVDSIILLSPIGNSFKVTVSDAGVIVTVLIPPGSHP